MTYRNEIGELERQLEEAVPGLVSDLVAGRCLVAIHSDLLSLSDQQQSLVRALQIVGTRYHNTVVIGNFANVRAFGVTDDHKVGMAT